MKEALITVVVPVYKVEKYLDRCVESIVNQTYRNLEIILVDDGSPDRSGQMCDVWAEKDNRIQVIHKKNAGLGMARNSGMEASTGEYICFVDSDDYIDVTTVEKSYTTMIRENAQIVVFGLTRVNAQGDEVRKIIPEPERTCFREEAVQKEFLPDFIDPEHISVKNRNLCLSAWSGMYSMDLVRSTGWRFVSEREMISEDSYSLIWLYSYVKSVAVLPEALYFYCENETSLTQTYREDRFEKIKEFHGQCTKMAMEMGYSRAICVRISGLFLAFTIAAMKQIAAADLPAGRQKSILSGIVDDTLMQSILHDKDCQYRSPLRRILFFAMRRKWYGFVQLLLRLQQLKEGRR